MAAGIKKAAQEGDSVGGTVECAVIGLPRRRGLSDVRRYRKPSGASPVRDSGGKRIRVRRWLCGGGYARF